MLSTKNAVYIHSAILRLLPALLRCHGELDGIGAKAAPMGTHPALFKPLSSFANRPGCDMLLFGLDGDVGFSWAQATRKLQKDSSAAAAWLPLSWQEWLLHFPQLQSARSFCLPCTRCHIQVLRSKAGRISPDRVAS